MTESRIQEALEYLSLFPETTLSEAARKFEVPRTTLSNRSKDAQPRKGRAATHMLLTKEEIAIYRYIDRLNKINLAVRPEFVADAAITILKARSSSRLQASIPTLGNNWVSRFLKRHKYNKTRQKISIRRVRMLKISITFMSTSRNLMKYCNTKVSNQQIFGIWMKPGFA
jgi:hypothetical protein